MRFATVFNCIIPGFLIIATLLLTGCATSTQFIKPAIVRADQTLDHFDNVPVVIQVNLISTEPGLYFRLWSIVAEADFTTDIIAVPLFDNMFLSSDAPPQQISGNTLSTPIILDMPAGHYRIKKINITDLATFNSSNSGAKLATQKLFPEVGFTVNAGQPVYLGQWNIFIQGVDKVGSKYAARTSFSFKPGSENDFTALKQQFPALNSRPFSFGQLGFN